MTTTPAELDEVVELVPYDAAWPEAFEAERRRLVDGLSAHPRDIEHIGSTAVPGLEAKPVIDMMLGVSHLPPRDLQSRAVLLGYQDFGEAGVPGRIYLRLRGAIAFNLHVVERGGEHWINNLALRDLLRRDPAARDRYSQAKRDALRSAGSRLLRYSAAKHPVVTELLTAARFR